MKSPIFLKSLVIGFAILLIPSIAMMQWVTHSHPAYTASRDWIKQSPLAAKYLGDGIESGWWVTMRSSRHTLTANVEYAVSGSRGKGEALVSAKKQGDNWELHTIWYRPDDGRVVALFDRQR